VVEPPGKGNSAINNVESANTWEYYRGMPVMYLEVIPAMLAGVGIMSWVLWLSLNPVQRVRREMKVPLGCLPSDVKKLIRLLLSEDS
jgi:hypothetical protein